MTVSNTHPHQSHDGKFVMVHNGVIENFGTLKQLSRRKRNFFSSETDSEVLCNLIAYHYSELPEDEDRFIDAVRLALPKCRGAYDSRFVPDYPDAMIGSPSWLASRGWPWRRCEFYRQRCIGFRWPSHRKRFFSTMES